MGGEPTAKAKARKENNMTNREFFVEVMQNETLSVDLRAHAEKEIAKLDAANKKRAEAQSKKSKENDPIKDSIYNLLMEKGTMTSPDIGTALELTTSKASAMCRQMVEDGRLTVSEIKVPKKGKLKAYTAVGDDTDGTVQATSWEQHTMD